MTPTPLSPKLLFFSIIVSTLLLCSCSSPEIDRPPNIIYIMADDLGYGDLGSFGQSAIQTPVLDQLAAEGIRFTQHYAGSTVCAPSRSCLMTGYHTGQTAIRANGAGPLAPEELTVAELLKEEGYKTGLVGKWGLGGPGTTGEPNRQGFDHFFGFLNQIRAHNYYPDYLWRNGEKVALRNEIQIADKTYAKGIGSAATKRVDYTQDLFTQEALNFIEQSKDQSFFLYLALTIPHANNEYWITSEHGMEVPNYGIYADKDWPDAQKGLAAMVSYMDRDIGKIIDLLKQLDIDDHTLVIFTSDNGPHAEGNNDPEFFKSNGPFSGKKRDLNEGGIRVPFFARWPGTIEGGRESDHLSAFWDFLPTACAVAGCEVPEGINGISYLPTLLGEESQEKHDYLYWEFYEMDGRQAIRHANWKGIRLGMHEEGDPPLQLYNLDNDLGEQNDLSLEMPTLVDVLKEKMKEAHTPWAFRKFKYEK